MTKPERSSSRPWLRSVGGEATRDRLLREALRNRRSAVRARLAASPTQAVAACPEPSDAEEALRRLMVRLRPRIHRGTATRQDQIEWLWTALSLKPTALSDLRHVDALNHVFELLEYLDLEDEEIRPVIGSFCHHYEDILSHHLEDDA